jgi:hypothetical protein
MADFVVTDRRRLDEFMRRGGRIDDLAMVVGQISGKPKYPKGHVGRRSRDGSTGRRRISEKELARRQVIRGMRRQLEGLDRETKKASMRQMRAALKKGGMSSRGLGRKSAPATPVARVAGVLASEDSYHVKAVEARRATFRAELDKLHGTLFGRGNAAAILSQIGQGYRDSIRQSFAASGHMDTGRLHRHIQYQIFSRSGKRRARDIARQLRALAKRRRR